MEVKNMENYDFGGCYFSRTLGFVIDGEHFSTQNEALEYLIREAYMDDCEAESFLYRLVRAFSARTRKAASSSAAVH